MLLLASSLPCKLREQGCNNNTIGWIVIVLLGVALIVVLSSMLWFRWKRGPFPWIVRLLSVWRR